VRCAARRRPRASGGDDRSGTLRRAAGAGPAREDGLDNICHTLAGAALGAAGLRRRTPLATATLLVGANLPDVDGLAYVFGSSVEALAFRRGWTHGVLAMAVLPVALAGMMSAWDRLVRMRRHPDAMPARFRALWLLASLSVLSHPLLDLLNTYGVRLLMPFSGRWFYGDALFIVDPWLWLLLALGIAWSRARERRGRSRPERAARVALWVAGLYVFAMLGSGLAGRFVAARQARAEGLAVTRLMVGPVPWDPLTRMTLLEIGDSYRFGTLRLVGRPVLRLSGEEWQKGDTSPAARTAAVTPEGRNFLTWSRFPAFRVEAGSASTRVQLLDARYPGPRGSWASITVEIPEASGRGLHAVAGRILSTRSGGSP
jgi:inner membrane protein